MGGTQATDPIVRVEGLTAAYGDEAILDDVSFDVRRGEVFAILGGSGSGKSTLLKHMIGLLEPAAGHVWINGADVVTAQGDARREIFRGIGVMYQSGALFGSMTLAENIELTLEEFTPLPAEARRIVARMKLELVGLGAAAEKMPSELSGGMKKRAGIARAMALDPEILFLDEPSAGLDPVTSADLDHLILDLAGDLGKTFVVVTHELESIFTIADRVIMLDQRTRGIIAEGRPADLKRSTDNPWVHQFFNPGDPLPGTPVVAVSEPS